MTINTLVFDKNLKIKVQGTFYTNRSTIQVQEVKLNGYNKKNEKKNKTFLIWSTMQNSKQLTANIQTFTPVTTSTGGSQLLISHK